ncbi:MAG: FmdB family transcriptional regulator [Spirochaetae bacterium HGW-Spirochaetae-1]|jgi:putative FmdB family regulatory protein|nr:MAG: FmdB family transcriptional regulator [Spirochaetae bacterium HGW-Spirochaetae-1]
MPTYEYKCTVCDHTFDVFQSMSDDPIKTCEKCGGEVRKLFGTAGIIFKGPGFYVNDYKKNGSSSASSSKSESAPACSGSCDSCSVSDQ